MWCNHSTVFCAVLTTVRMGALTIVTTSILDCAIGGRLCQFICAFAATLAQNAVPLFSHGEFIKVNDTVRLAAFVNKRFLDNTRCLGYLFTHARKHGTTLDRRVYDRPVFLVEGPS